MHLNLAKEAAELNLLGRRHLTRRLKEEQSVPHERRAELRKGLRRAEYGSHGEADSGAEAAGEGAKLERRHALVCKLAVRRGRRPSVL